MINMTTYIAMTFGLVAALMGAFAAWALAHGVRRRDGFAVFAGIMFIAITALAAFPALLAAGFVQ